MASSIDLTTPLSLFDKAKTVVKKYMKVYTLCIIFASLGGFLFGFDTGSIGPITTMSQFQSSFAPISASLQGLVVSCILITAALTSVVAGSLSDRISRTRVFTLGSSIFAFGSALCASAPAHKRKSGLAQLLAGRLIAGAGEGLFLGVIIVYTCEIAPKESRGRLACTLQLLITIGLAAGYFFCYGADRIESSLAWRAPFILQSVFAVLYALGSLFLIHSPRWLQHVGRDTDAANAWARLGLNAVEAEKEDEERARAEQTEVASASAGGAGRRGGWWVEASQLWARDVRLRTFLGCFLMAMQQLSGIDGVLYYAPTLFKQAGLSSTQAAFFASGVSGLLNIACTILIQPFQDKLGRRPLVLYGGSVIAFCMLSIGSIYASSLHTTPGGRWAVIVLIYIFVAAFALSWAVANRIYASEIQPMRTRAAATGLGQAANWTVNWAVAFGTPLFLARVRAGPYFLFGASTALTVGVCAAFAPESKGVSLERLDEVFSAASPWRQMLARVKEKGALKNEGASGRPGDVRRSSESEVGVGGEIIELDEIRRSQVSIERCDSVIDKC